MTETEQLDALERCEAIGDALPTLYLGWTIHIFEIEVDGILFRVSVQGKDVEVLPLK